MTLVVNHRRAGEDMGRKVTPRFAYALTYGDEKGNRWFTYLDCTADSAAQVWKNLRKSSGVVPKWEQYIRKHYKAKVVRVRIEACAH